MNYCNFSFSQQHQQQQKYNTELNCNYWVSLKLHTINVLRFFIINKRPCKTRFSFNFLYRLCYSVLFGCQVSAEKKKSEIQIKRNIIKKREIRLTFFLLYLCYHTNICLNSLFKYFVVQQTSYKTHFIQNAIKLQSELH